MHTFLERTKSATAETNKAQQRDTGTNQAMTMKAKAETNVQEISVSTLSPTCHTGNLLVSAWLIFFIRLKACTSKRSFKNSAEKQE